MGQARTGGCLHAEALLAEARERERAGCIPEAAEHYQAAIAEAERAGAERVLAEALRGLAVLRFQQSDGEHARALAQRSYDVARAADNALLAAEALNTLATIDLQIGALDAAEETYRQALTLGSHNRELLARVEQNLGVLANIHGDHARAEEHYRRSLDAWHTAGNPHECAIAYHNLGMVSADQELWDRADRYFGESRHIAEELGDLYLTALCSVNHAEVHLARQCYDQARADAESALAIFDQLGVTAAKADAYRMIGMVYRDTGRTALAESRLRGAIALAADAGSVLAEAEGCRELALLYQGMGRNQDTLTLLSRAHRLFKRLDARVDIVHVGGKVAELEATYLAVVRDWGQSIESSDSYTHGHCERVADYAVAVARALGCVDEDLTTIRIGAYLHDLGKVKVPHEILNKPGALTSTEREIMQMHPVWGLELLGTVEFPWDIKPIIRWHHEKHDGTGYPDRLQGDEIPLPAQIIGIADVFDALTTTRSYRPAMSHAQARREMAVCRAWWRPDVYDAFVRALERGPARAAA